ncbi:iron-sulfur cluster assembly scaffold protein [Wenxinia marina]|uniref:NifU-like protein involved in Fe-S cluster formation n=1 Tax=Wenxinia marina DSM 24838 TaxID=1123501 RepID=A0A0D0NKA9_9RHOB|nr:iron-sulfur cluster assembly scaffold protein [Wenxinia marina]KIQ68745.1 NifU-like protein involved in Fe-S cluster formation [Wenxinia marina DSM 24838]GGL65496.1 iron-sulfur cluster scaffold-like protein [Wenxinia marina]
MSETDLIKLYSGRILELAASIPHRGRLDAPEGTARKRSPLCGSTVTVDLNVEDGRVAQFAQDVKACALGQASASILGASVVGQDEATIRRGRDELVAMLKENGPVPSAPFDELKVLEPAKDYRNRHPSILLAFEATLDAFEAARARQSA